LRPACFEIRAGQCKRRRPRGRSLPAASRTAVPAVGPWVLLACLLLGGAGCPHGQATEPPPRSTSLRLEPIPQPLYAAPQLTFRGELAQVLFHLNLHNEGTEPLHLRRVELVSLRQGQVLSRLELGEALLRQRLRAGGWIVMRDRLTIAAAHRQRGLLRRPKGDTLVPPRGVVSLTHQLSVDRFSTLPDRIRCVAHHDGGAGVAELPVEVYRQRTALRLPVEGRWWVIDGNRFDGHHASAILASQIFAYDLGRLGPDLATWAGDTARNSAYHASGQPIVAVADGEVVAIHDGVPENTPGRRPTWQSILQRPHDLAGNYVVLRHAGQEHSVYIHLRPGLQVKVGQRVERGQVLGRCGNSGNSLEPHLHFQLQDGPDPLRAAGLPVRFSDFTIHLAHLRLYVPPDKPVPLPVRLVVEPGRAPGAVELSSVLAP
jgi:hypothetical protein